MKPLNGQSQSKTLNKTENEVQNDKIDSCITINTKEAEYIENSTRKIEKRRDLPRNVFEVQRQKLRLIKMLSRNPEMK